MADAERVVQITITGKNLAGPEFDKVRQALAGVRSETDSTASRARKLEQDWQTLRRTSKNTDDTMTKMWSGMRNAAGLVGVTFGAGAIVAFGASVFAAAERVKDISGRLGISYDAAQRFTYAVQQGGGTVDDLEKSLAVMNRTLAVGDRSTVAALGVLGLQLQDLRRMKPEDAFAAIADRIGDIEDPMVRAQVAQELLGKSALKLLPSMVEGFQDLARSATVMSDETVEGLEAAKQAWENLGNRAIVVSGNVIGWISKTIEQQRAQAKIDRDAVREAIATGESYEAIRKRLTAATTADTAATTEHTGAQAGAVAQARNWSAELATARASVEGLSRARRAEIATAMEAGATTAELTQQFGLSDVAVRMLKDQTQRLEERQRAQTKAAEESRREAERLAAQHAKLFGLDTIQHAESLATLIGDFPDAWRMTDEAQRQSLETLNAALAAYKRLGLEAPEHVRRLAQELEFLAKVGPGGNAGVQAFTSARGSVGLQRFAPTFETSLAGGRGASGLQAWLAGLGGSTGLGAAPGQNPIQLLFGMTSTQFGAELGKTITGAVMGGGNVGEAAGSFVGQSLGTSIAKQSGKAIEGVFGKTVGGAITAAIPGIGALLGPLAGKLVGKIVGLFTGGEGAKANDLRDQLKAKFGDAAGAGLAAAVEKFRGVSGVASAYEQFMRGGTQQQVQQAFDELTRTIAAAEETMSRYGLSLDDTKSPQDRLAASTKRLSADLETLRGLGFSNAQMARGMAKELNDLVRTALDAGGKIPEAFGPMLEELVRGGLLADDLAARLLGVPQKAKAPWQEMQAIAEEFGIDVEKLGINFQQSKLIDGAQTLAEKWNLLVENGADVGAVIEGMADRANGFLRNALKWGLEVPLSMKPMLEKMLEAGKLTDENGEKLESLAGVQWGADAAKQFEPVVEALWALVDVFKRDLPESLEEFRRNAARGVDIPFRTGTEGTGNNPSDPNGDDDGDGVPNQYDTYPNDPTAYGSGGIARGRQIAVLAEQGKQEIVGTRAFMSDALTGAMQNVMASTGNGPTPFSVGASSSAPAPILVQLILDGRVLDERSVTAAQIAAAQGRLQLPAAAVTGRVPRG